MFQERKGFNIWSRVGFKLQPLIKRKCSIEEALDNFSARTLYEKHRTITLYPYTVNGRIQITERDQIWPPAGFQPATPHEKKNVLSKTRDLSFQNTTLNLPNRNFISSYPLILLKINLSSE